MPVGYHPLTPAERCPIHARLHRGVVETGDGPRSRTGPRDDLAGDLTPPRPVGLPAPAGRRQGDGPSSGGFGGALEEDTGALGGRGRTVAGRMEPGADRWLGSVAGRRDGGPGVDLPAGAGGSAGRRDPVPVPATSGPEAEWARRPLCRTRSHSRSGGPCGAAGSG